jgi:acyloxyacyl hydrolase
MYDFMNCLEENPCWGWLNTNQTVRRLTTQRSNELNQVYRNISATLKFDNFDFIFYAPNWVKLFNG